MTLMIMIPELKDLELHKIWLAGWHFESEKQRTQTKKDKKKRICFQLLSRQTFRFYTQPRPVGVCHLGS
jgi:hypothetical protein